jgi:HAD superfamily hydrolase (TIGR01509 family)
VFSAFDLVIFDLDGVLIDSEVLSCTCLVETLGRYGVSMMLGEVMERFLGRSFEVVVLDFEHRTGAPMPAEFVADLHATLIERFEQSLQAMPHAIELLKRVDVPFCLASSSNIERIRVSLEVSKLAPFFKGRIFHSAMVEHGKPAPDLFLRAASDMGAAARRALVIEDSVSGVTAGKAAGMTVWGFVGGSHYAGTDPASRLQAAGADRIVTSLAEILPVVAARS